MHVMVSATQYEISQLAFKVRNNRSVLLSYQFFILIR